MKLSIDKKRKCFSILVQDENELHRAVCFSPEKHRFFEKIANDNRNSGIKIKRFKFGNNDNEIMVNDFTSVKSTDLDFTYKSPGLRNFAVQQIVNEYAIYEVANL